MKLIGKENDQLQLQFGRREKDLFLHLLGFYPRIPPGHHKVSKSGTLKPSNQQLLDEAMAEHRSDNQKQLSALLSRTGRWVEHRSGWRLTLKASEAEWLLQVLNDIRVGSWVLLGCPEEPIKALDQNTAPHLWAMEIAGSFQLALLQMLESSP